MTRYSIPQDFGLSAEVIKQAQQAQRKKAIVNIVNLFFTFIIYIIITIVFVTPFIYLLGNSFRVNSQSIWGNLFPVSWKSFIPYDGVTLKNYIQALGLDVVSQGFGMNMSRALWMSLHGRRSVDCCKGY